VPREEHLEPTARGELSPLVVRLLRAAAFLAVVLLLFALFAHEAWSARAANIVKKSFSYKGDAARAFAALLELPPDRPTVLSFELSQQAELQAMPDREKDFRDPGAVIPGDLAGRTSTLIHETVTWDPAAATLTLDGYVSDMNTALPAQGGLAWSFKSPAFAEAEVDKLPGYKPLLPKLAALPAKAMSGGMLQRTLDVTLDDKEHASLELWRIQTWDSNNNPVPRSFIIVRFGPTLEPRMTWSPGSKNEGGNGAKCGCRQGRAEPRSGVWALGAAAAWVVRRKRRSATSRTPPRVSPSPRSRVSAPDS
jgi:hypothetical protein